MWWQDYAESKVEGMDDQLKRMKIQVEELTRTKDDLTQLRNRLTEENSVLQRQIHDLEVNLDTFTKNKSQAQQKLESTMTKLEEEVRVRNFCWNISTQRVRRSWEVVSRVGVLGERVLRAGIAPFSQTIGLESAELRSQELFCILRFWYFMGLVGMDRDIILTLWWGWAKT